MLSTEKCQISFTSDTRNIVLITPTVQTGQSSILNGCWIDLFFVLKKELTSIIKLDILLLVRRLSS